MNPFTGRPEWEPEPAVLAEIGRSTQEQKNAKAGSAGINRQEAEDERSSRERSSDPLGPEFCAGYREVHSEA
jgi:hypothetical protein